VGVFEAHTGHEQVVFCQDSATGLRAIIAIYSTALGPSVGGTRFYPYPSEDDALTDALNLSKAMAYKAACAGLDFGGGKAVIIGDPDRDKSEPLLRAYGRFVQSLHGRYYTACDVGTYVADMDIVARECRYVTGRSPEHDGAGDSSVLTALGVFRGMQAAAQRVWGTPSLAGRRVGVAGVGKVGYHLIAHLVSDGASVVVADIDPAAIARAQAAHSVDTIDAAALTSAPMDVYAPCALGGSVDDQAVRVLQAQVICGGANNQLAHSGIDKQLTERGILYAPDYVVNSGGLIAVSDEIHGYSEARARQRTMQIFDTTMRVFRMAGDEGMPPGAAADRLAEDRISEASRLRSIALPG